MEIVVPAVQVEKYVQANSQFVAGKQNADLL